MSSSSCQERLPVPSVFKTCPEVPSTVGKEKAPLISNVSEVKFKVSSVLTPATAVATTVQPVPVDSSTFLWLLTSKTILLTPSINSLPFALIVTLTLPASPTVSSTEILRTASGAASKLIVFLSVELAKIRQPPIGLMATPFASVIDIIYSPYVISLFVCK